MKILISGSGALFALAVVGLVAYVKGKEDGAKEQEAYCRQEYDTRLREEVQRIFREVNAQRARVVIDLDRVNTG
jgi:hypothetical protein